MSMKVLLMGEGRHPDGRIAAVMDSVLEGIRGEDATGEQMFLSDYSLSLCRQCVDGQGLCQTHGRCAQDDDLGRLIEMISLFDAAVFVSKVYVPDVHPRFRAMLDRLKRVREFLAMPPLPKPALAVCIGGSASSILDLFGQSLSNCGFRIVEAIAVATRDVPLQREAFRSAGRRLTQHCLARNASITDEKSRRRHQMKK
ncbi:MAG: NAD(P)H-dependent oxidoreductase [Planctomycetaceae bacterium]|nr:NAD(P)H-dependent oxidoreductase [Planctomycetaceae bacterium]